jgi:hypothetical protein
VYSLQFHAKSGKLFASTHGRSAWSLTFGPSLVASPSSLVFNARPGQTPSAQTVTVSNGDTGGSTLNFTAAAMGAAWLSVTPGMGRAVGGMAGMPLSVSVSTGGLGLGDYMGNIVLSAPNANPTSITVPVQLHISDTPPPVDAGGSQDAGADVSSGATTGSGGGPGTGTTSTTGSAGASVATTGAGGAPGTGGSNSTPSGTGGSNSGGPGTAGDDGGCGCRIARGEAGRSLFVVALTALASIGSIVRRRRRATRRDASRRDSD